MRTERLPDLGVVLRGVGFEERGDAVRRRLSTNLRVIDKSVDHRAHTGLLESFSSVSDLSPHVLNAVAAARTCAARARPFLDRATANGLLEFASFTTSSKSVQGATTSSTSSCVHLGRRQLAQ